LRSVRDRRIPVNEVLVLELIRPMSDPSAVVRLARTLKIEPEKEPHLLWIAKQAAVEGLPEGWEEVPIYGDNGAVVGIQYRNVDLGITTKDNPLLPTYAPLVKWSRTLPKPRPSARQLDFIFPPRRPDFRDPKPTGRGGGGDEPSTSGSTDEKEKMNRVTQMMGKVGFGSNPNHPKTTKSVTFAAGSPHAKKRTRGTIRPYLYQPPVPHLGAWVPIWTYRGEVFWLHAGTGKRVFEVGTYIRDASAVAIQRHVRGFLARVRVLRLGEAVRVLEENWRKRKLLVVMRQLRRQREAAAVVVQKKWAAKKVRRVFCREMILQIGMIGLPMENKAIARARVAGLLHTAMNFYALRRRIVLLQRTIRVWLGMRNFRIPKNTGLVTQTVLESRDEFRKMFMGY
jgi:hypothetical protein